MESESNKVRFGDQYEFGSNLSIFIRNTIETCNLVGTIIEESKYMPGIMYTAIFSCLSSSMKDCFLSAERAEGKSPSWNQA